LLVSQAVAFEKLRFANLRRSRFLSLRNSAFNFRGAEADSEVRDVGDRKKFRPGFRFGGRPAELSELSVDCRGRQAALRRAGALRVARALRAGLRRALPERLAVVFFVARLVAFFFAILAMSFLSLFPGGFSAQYESTLLKEKRYGGSR
jgi:hypothetical protein